MNTRFGFAKFLAVGTLFFSAVSSAEAATLNLGSLTPGVQYLIDQSQTVLGVDQFNRPRNNRGLAISPDGQFLYAGYNNPSGNFEVRKIDLNEPDYNDATVANLVGVSRGKAIDVDDQGRVYLADGDRIKIYDANLTSLQHEIVVTKSEGVAARREAGTLYLYASDRTTGKLTKYEMSESGGSVIGSSVDASWGSSGEADVNTIDGDLRGVEIDSNGRIWIADNDNGVYVVEANGNSSQLISSITSALDVGFDDDTAYVTRSTEMLISSFDVGTLASAGLDFLVDVSSLDLTASPSTGGAGGIEGIVVIPNSGIFLAGDGINTADGRSTYGRTDGESGFDGPDFFTDLTHDDNDPILSLRIPEPTSAALLLSSVLAGILTGRSRP